MPSKPSDKTESRRDFFRSLLGETRKATAQDTHVDQAVQAMKRRASIIALRYGQNEIHLTQIRLEEPIRRGGENHLYRININGHAMDGASTKLELYVDIAKGKAHIPEPECDD